MKNFLMFLGGMDIALDGVEMNYRVVFQTFTRYNQ